MRNDGWTLVELLVVILILAVTTGAEIPLPSTFDQRPENQVKAAGATELIANAEAQFRSTNADGDALDDYATLAELNAAGYISTTIASGLYSGYEILLTTTPAPSFSVRANPFSCHVGILRFYDDETLVLRVNETGPAGPTDPPAVPGDIHLVPNTHEKIYCDLAVRSKAKTFIHVALNLSEEASLQQAAELAGTPGLVDSIPTRLDANGDESFAIEEYVDGDLLGIARALAGELGDSGPPVGSDADLVAILEDHQAWLADEFDLELDPPQPLIPLTALYGHESEVVAYLISLENEIPALGALGLASLASALMAAGLFSRRRVDGRSATAGAGRPGRREIP